MNLQSFTTLYGSITGELAFKISVTSNVPAEPLQGGVRFVLPRYATDDIKTLTWRQGN